MTRLHRILLDNVIETVQRHNMIREGDRIVVAVSGGKDSFAAWRLLNDCSSHLDFRFKLFPVFVDAGYSLLPTNQLDKLRSHFLTDADHFIVIRDPYGPEILASQEKNPCFSCSRKRRKNLFEMAHELDCRKVVLAHNRDDVIETLLMNQLYSREISTILPVQPLFDGQYQIIRPLWYIEEKYLAILAREQHFPIIANPCPFDGNTRRSAIKSILNELEATNKHIRDNLFASLFRVNRAFLPDWDFFNVGM